MTIKLPKFIITILCDASTLSRIVQELERLKEEIAFGVEVASEDARSAQPRSSRSSRSSRPSAPPKPRHKPAPKGEMSEAAKMILDYMVPGSHYTANDLQKVIAAQGYAESSASTYCTRLVKSGALRRTTRGLYTKP